MHDMRKTEKRDKTGHIRKIQYTAISFLIVMIAIVAAVMVNIRHLYGQKEDEKQEKIQIVQTEQDHKDITRLREQLIQYIKENESSREDVGFYIEDLESGDSIELNGDQLYVAASTYKLPLAMVYYDHINAGKMSAEEYEDLLNSMIVNSDNEAAEYLFDNLGGYDEFKRLIASYDDEQEADPAYVSYENEFTPRNMGHILGYLYHHKDAYDPLIKNMKASMPGQFLDRNLNIYFAQKYGSYDWSYNAAGLSLTGHPYSIAIYTTLGDAGETVIGDMNEICFRYFNDSEE